MSDPDAKPNLFRQFTTTTTAVGSSVIGGIRSTAGVLIHKTASGSSVNESEHVNKVNTRVEVEEEEDRSQYPDMSNVSLSSDDNDSGHNLSTKQNKHANEGFLGQIKNTSETAGTAIIGGLKATTNLLNPMKFVKPSDGGEAEREKDNKKIHDEFDHIYIDESVEEEEEKPKPKPSFLETIKTKTGLNHPASSNTEHTQPNCQQQLPSPPDHNNSNHQKEPPKETFLDQIKSRTGLQQHKDKPREEDIARDSAPKDGFLSHLKNPFAASADHHTQQHASHTNTTTTHTTNHSRFHHNSTGHNTTRSNSTSNSGITSMFDSFSGKSHTTATSTTKRPEPAKQASFFDHLTGKSSPPPKKEPGFFDQLTGNTGKPAKSNSDSSFW